jgi:hypothetical protein
VIGDLLPEAEGILRGIAVTIADAGKIYTALDEGKITT